MTYVVKRTYNRHGDHDYLIAWDRRWGTVCCADRKQAMGFASKAEADAAVKKARCYLADCLSHISFTATA